METATWTRWLMDIWTRKSKSVKCLLYSLSNANTTFYEQDASKYCS